MVFGLELIKPDYVTHTFKDLLTEHKMRPIRFHDLRHSCISILANDPKFTMKQVQEYAGHVDFTITVNLIKGYTPKAAIIRYFIKQKTSQLLIEKSV